MRQVWRILAEVGLILVVIGLLIAIWMPAYVGAPAPSP